MSGRANFYSLENDFLIPFLARKKAFLAFALVTQQSLGDIFGLIDR